MIPFVRLFYGSRSVYLWEDDMGETHEREGGEQGDPLMPLLFSLGQHRALRAVNARLIEGESLFAFLDDLYVLCSPFAARLASHGRRRHLPAQTWLAASRIKVHRHFICVHQGGPIFVGGIESDVAFTGRPTGCMSVHVRAMGPPGFSHDSPRTPNVHI